MNIGVYVLLIVGLFVVAIGLVGMLVVIAPKEDDEEDDEQVERNIENEINNLK